MSAIFINPGTGPVEDHNVANALAAMRRFAAAVHPEATIGIRDDSEDDGRYPFLLALNGRCVEVDMPGCDPDLTAKSQAWVSPRLYVDGSSWLWEFGVSVARDELTEPRP